MKQNMIIIAFTTLLLISCGGGGGENNHKAEGNEPSEKEVELDVKLNSLANPYIDQDSTGVTGISGEINEYVVELTKNPEEPATNLGTLNAYSANITQDGAAEEENTALIIDHFGNRSGEEASVVTGIGVKKIGDDKYILYFAHKDIEHFEYLVSQNILTNISQNTVIGSTGNGVNYAYLAMDENGNIEVISGTDGIMNFDFINSEFSGTFNDVIVSGTISGLYLSGIATLGDISGEAYGKVASASEDPGVITSFGYFMGVGEDGAFGGGWSY